MLLCKLIVETQFTYLIYGQATKGYNFATNKFVAVNATVQSGFLIMRYTFYYTMCTVNLFHIKKGFKNNVHTWKYISDGYEFSSYYNEE